MNYLAEFLENLAFLAAKNLTLMDGTTEPVTALLSDSEVGFAVWPDATQALGFSYLIVKGERRIAGVSWTGKAAEIKVTAIPCKCAEEAETLRRVFGENN